MAGLLMFGKSVPIHCNFPNLRFDYLDLFGIEPGDGLVDFLRDEYHSVHGKLRMTTARAYIYLFSAALNLAVENGLIARNPLFL